MKDSGQTGRNCALWEPCGNCLNTASEDSCPHFKASGVSIRYQGQDYLSLLMNADTFWKPIESKTASRQQSMVSRLHFRKCVLFLYFGLPACNQSMLKWDWSVLLRQLMTAKILPTYSDFCTERHPFLEMTDSLKRSRRAIVESMSWQQGWLYEEVLMMAGCSWWSSTPTPTHLTPLLQLRLRESEGSYGETKWEAEGVSQVGVIALSGI